MKGGDQDMTGCESYGAIMKGKSTGVIKKNRSREVTSNIIFCPWVPSNIHPKQILFSVLCT